MMDKLIIKITKFINKSLTGLGYSCKYNEHLIPPPTPSDKKEREAMVRNVWKVVFTEEGHWKLKEPMIPTTCKWERVTRCITETLEEVGMFSMMFILLLNLIFINIARNIIPTIIERASWTQLRTVLLVQVTHSKFPWILFGLWYPLLHVAHRNPSYPGLQDVPLQAFSDKQDTEWILPFSTILKNPLPTPISFMAVPLFLHIKPSWHFTQFPSAST